MSSPQPGQALAGEDPAPHAMACPHLLPSSPAVSKHQTLLCPDKCPVKMHGVIQKLIKAGKKKRKMPRRATEITIIIINFFPSCSTTENSGVSKSHSHVVLIIYLGQTDRRYFTFLLCECVIIFLLCYVCETRV